MKILDNFSIFEDGKRQQTVVTIGNFDGVHLGHKKLFDVIRNIANDKGYKSVIITFNPHPIEVVKKDNQFLYIFSSDEKDDEIAKENIDYFIKYPFTKEFSSILAKDFIDLLIEKINCKVLVVGEDYCFGKDRAGNVDMLYKIGKQKGLEILKIQDILIDGQRVSSTSIRTLLKQGKIEKANLFLDKPFYIKGEVVEGNKLGRTIGFPTANIIPDKKKILPPDGVYVTRLKYKNKFYNSVTNIGKNPTVNNSIRTIETHIFDFDENIYGEKIEVYFYKHIREIKKFNSIDELKLQINLDSKKALEFLKG